MTSGEMGTGYQPEDDRPHPETQEDEPELPYEERAKRYLAKVQEYANQSLTPEQLAERFERDGGADFDGFRETITDRALGEIELAFGAIKVGEHYWPYYPAVFLAGDILQDPQYPGRTVVRRGAWQLLWGGMGYMNVRDTKSRMRDFAKLLKDPKSGEYYKNLAGYDYHGEQKPMGLE